MTPPLTVRPAADDDLVGVRDLLLRLSGMLEVHLRRDPPEAPLCRPSSMQDLLDSLYRLRRRRDALFPPGLFGEPAWDMLLDLATRQSRRLSTSVSSACIASAVPATTALRHVEKLVEAGLVERVRDPRDGRRIFVRPTRATLNAFQDLSQGI